jgi:hypothetical protein
MPLYAGATTLNKSSLLTALEGQARAQPSYTTAALQIATSFIPSQCMTFKDDQRLIFGIQKIDYSQSISSSPLGSYFRTPNGHAFSMPYNTRPRRLEPGAVADGVSGCKTSNILPLCLGLYNNGLNYFLRHVGGRGAGGAVAKQPSSFLGGKD